MVYLIALYLIFYFFLAYLRLEWSVLLLLAFLPAYLIRFNIFGIPFTLLEAMILISFLVWFISRTEFKNFIKGKYGWQDFLKNRTGRRNYPFGWEIILLLFVSFVAVAIAGFSNSALGIGKAYFFEPILLFILVLNIFQTNPKKIIWPFLLSSLAVSALAIYQGFSGNLILNDFWAEAGQRRATSFFGYPNAVGLYLASLILVMFGWLFNQIGDCVKENTKIFKVSNLKIFFIFATIILSFLAIYFSKSKGALVGIMVGLGTFFLFSVGKRMRWVIVFLILIIGAGVFDCAPLRNFALEKTIHSKSLQIIQQQWKETWEMLKDGHLISGAGLANYQKVIFPYHQEGIFLRDYNDPDWHRKTVFNAEYRAQVWQPTEIYLYPHNIFLNFWSELGLAGLLLFVWIIVKYLFIAVRLSAKDRENKFFIFGLLGAMVVIIVHGLVDVPYFKNDLSIMFWVLVAMLSLVNYKFVLKK